MEDLSKQYQSLREAVEKAAGRKMNTPRDFNHLVACIQSSTNELISATTLKRFWGYLDKSKVYTPFKFTLDTLSVYVGYKDWETFMAQSNASKKIESAPVKNNVIYSTSLKSGDRLNIIWNPDRNITVRHMGEDMFVVEESTNSKLQVGDRFCCGVFIENEALYLSRLTRGEEVLGAYICGKENGIKYLLQLSNRGVNGYISTNYTSYIIFYSRTKYYHQQRL